MTLYERTLTLAETLRTHGNVSNVTIEHAYREHNGAADGFVNEALDTYSVRNHWGGLVIDDGWSDVSIVADRIRFVDTNEDVTMTGPR